MKKNLFSTLCLFAAICMASCGKTPVETPVTDVPVTEVKIDEVSLALAIGDIRKLAATVLPDDATDKTVVWASLNPAVATVENGFVTATAAGTATVTATAGGRSATCAITVAEEVIHVTEVIIDKKSLALETGDTETLTATVLPEDATIRTVVWTSTDTAVVTVDNGQVTAVSEGVAIIKATADGQTGECVVTVANAVVHVEEVTLDKETLTIEVGDTETLLATVLPENATDRTVVWTSSAPDIATVEDGSVSGIAVGTATITATADGKSAICTITVAEQSIPATGITLSSSAMSLEVNAERRLTATVTPSNSTDNVVWTSSAPAVAAVEDGLVRALAVGTATITATAGGQSAICTVTVSSAEQNEKWARSNIVWIADSSYPDGGYLSFAVTPADNAAIPANVTGLLFKWGSLVATSPAAFTAGNTAYKADIWPAGDIIYSPTQVARRVWIELPYTNESGAPFNNSEPTDDDFATYNSNTGYNTSNNKGDICRLISDKGWVAGDWRLPTAREMDDLVSSRVSIIYGVPENFTGGLVPPGTSANGNNAYGFYQVSEGHMVGEGIFAGDDMANPAKGMFLPAGGSRMTDGTLKTTGSGSSFWSATSSGTTSAGYMWSGMYSIGSYNTPRQHGFPIRCIRK